VSLFNHYDQSFNRVRNGKEKRDPIGGSSLIEEESIYGSPYLLAPLAGRIHEAPDVVIKALDYMFTAPEEELVALGFREKGSHGFKNNSRFCEILGLDPLEINVMDEVKKFIIQAE
jgi:hypothetical protein